MIKPGFLYLFFQDLMREDLESSFRLQSEREILRQHEEQTSRKMKRIIDKAYAVDAEKLKVTR